MKGRLFAIAIAALAVSVHPGSTDARSGQGPAMTAAGGRLVLTWDKVMASVPFTVGR